MATIIPKSVVQVFINANSYCVLGVLFNWGLYGALSAQVYLYYLAFPEDRIFQKALVYSIYFLETVKVILLLVAGIYEYSNPAGSWNLLGIPYNNSSNLIFQSVYLIWTTALPMLGGCVIFIVQSFYAYRLHIFARSWVIVVLILSLALAQLIVTMVGGSLGPMLQSLWTSTLYARDYYLLSLTWAVLTIACDIIIATAMTYFLLRSDSDMGWKSTHTLLVKLVRLAIETGTVTVIISIIALIFLRKDNLFPNEFQALVAVSVSGKIYSNAVMVNLNHRIKIHGGRNDPQDTSFVMPLHSLLVHDSSARDTEIRENDGRMSRQIGPSGTLD